MMYKYLFLIMLFLIGCANFPTRLELVENDKVRVLEFMYEPLDAAPGDTVTLTAVFAGKTVTKDMIDWTVSHKVTFSIYGADSAFDIQPLVCTPVQTYFSQKTSSIKLSFVVPDSIMYNSPAIKTNWTEMLPVEYRNNIPEEYRNLSRDAILDTVRHLANVIKSSDETTLHFIKQGIGDSALREISSLLQLFSVDMRIFANVHGAYTIESDFVVRYNRIFNRLASEYVKVNRNPVIDSVAVYKVQEKGLLQFKPASQTYSRYRLYGEEKDSVTVIPVDKNCSYFIQTYSSQRDSSISLGGHLKAEDHVSHPFYEHSATESDGISGKDYMSINRIDNDSILVLIPPTNDKIHDFTLWMKVRDNFLNENNRPLGTSLREFRGRFLY